MQLHHFIWLPFVFVFYAIYGWFTKQNMDHADITWYQSKPFWTLLGIGAIGQIWPFVSRVSTNIVFDSFLFDIFAVAAYLGMLIYLGASHAFTPINYAGVTLCLVGLFMMKI